MEETFKILTELSNSTGKRNKAVRNKPKKRTIQKVRKSTGQKSEVKKLKAKVKSLEKKLKQREYSPVEINEVLNLSNTFDENIRILSEITGIDEDEIRDLTPDVEPPSFDLSDKSILKIEFKEGQSYEERIQAVAFLAQSSLDKFRLRDKLLPRAFLPILEITHGKETIQRANKMSPPSMGTTLEEVIGYIQDFMREFKDNFFEYLKDHPGGFDDTPDDEALLEGTESTGESSSSWVFDPENVTAVYIRFIYAPTE